MFRFTPSLDHHTARHNLEELIRPDIDASSFRADLRRLGRMSVAWLNSCPPPWPAPSLVITPGVRYQSELWLPLADIAAAFNRLYRAALTYPPVLSSTPFHTAASWCDLFAALPPRLQSTADPARLLGALLDNRALLEQFLFASFLPRRFYGGFVRYPGQEGFIRGWLDHRGKGALRCLDAACGDGAGSYALARLLLERGWEPEGFVIEGWTLDPLEVWAAAHGAFPHDPRREEGFRKWTAPVFEQGGHHGMVFRAAELQNPLDPTEERRFDLILCNGLLGGPIINRRQEMLRVVGNLAGLLTPGGLLLAADHFHGGWKKEVPGEALGELIMACGLEVIEAGEGIGGISNP